MEAVWGPDTGRGHGPVPGRLRRHRARSRSREGLRRPENTWWRYTSLMPDLRAIAALDSPQRTRRDSISSKMPSSMKQDRFLLPVSPWA